ncbi:MAG: hypothetical protein Q8Q11_01430 [bacterium]|nr:hypothetical protein [bacterium]MDZ4248067.1 hypothetical protein [Patescibacteria group bacterium]
MDERHFNTALNREPEETLGETSFLALADSIRLAELLARTSDGQTTESDLRPGYSVQRHDGPDGLITLHISWTEGDDFVGISARNDYGPGRDKFAGDRVKLSKIGRVLEARTLSDRDLLEQTALIDECARESGFRAKTLPIRILHARAA